MTRKLAKRLKVQDEDLETSSPSCPLMTPDSVHSAARKKRKKLDNRDGNSSTFLEVMACNLSEEKSESVVSGVHADVQLTVSKRNDRAAEVKENLKDRNLPTNAETPVRLSNLDLVRMLQDRKEPRSRKIEVAFDYITNHERVPGRHGDELDNFRRQVRMVDSMAMPQFVSFLSEWVQSALLWSCKPQQIKKIPNIREGIGLRTLLPAHLDSRYWAILRWCLSSGYLHKFASISPSIMRALNLYVVAVLGPVGLSEDSMESDNQCERPCLTEDVVRSIEVLLLANERSFRPDLDHWFSLASTALSKFTSLTHSIFAADPKLFSPLHSLLVLILEGFARFVAIHPNRRKIFTSLVENLLELLLTAHACLKGPTSQHNANFTNKPSSCHEKLLTATEEVLEKGLFHAAHVGSFQEVCTVLAGMDEVNVETKSIGKKGKRKFSSRDSDANLEEEDTDIHLSYHKLLFRKLDHFRMQGIEMALMELGWMFETYSKSFRTHQVAGDVGALGIKTKGKQQHHEVTSNNGQMKDVEGEGNAKLLHSAQVADKKGQSNEILFSVFAEFLGPLMKDLETLYLSLQSKEAGALTFEDIFSVKLVFGAVTPLLKAAKTENTYVPTEDSSSQANITFLGKCYNTVVGIAKTLPGVLGSYGSSRLKGNKDLQSVCTSEHLEFCKINVLLAEILGNVISAIKYLMELEYRVVENSLGDVWAILFAEVSFQLSSAQVQESCGHVAKNGKQEAIQVACDVISIFSDLRQVDRVLFALSATLRRFISQDSWLSFIDLEAVEFLACAKSLLLAVALAIHNLPEGQVAEFLLLLRVDASDSIALLDVADRESTAKSATVALKGLVELYSYILHNVKITTTNSIQTGKAVQQFLIEIVTPKLVELIDFFLSSEHAKETKVGDISEKKLKKNRPAKCCDARDLKKGDATSKTKGAKSVLDTWICVFFIRMYMNAKSLQKECISLMPPKAAKKANAGFDYFDIDYHRCNIPDILTCVSSGSFFGIVGRGNVKVSELLAGIGKCLECQELLHLPPFLYSLDSVVVHTLVELTRHVNGVSFLLARTTEVTTPNAVDSLEGGQTFSADNLKLHVPQKLQKLLKSLKHECQKLTKILLKGFFPTADVSQDFIFSSLISSSPGEENISDSNDSRARSGKKTSQIEFLHQSWDSVEATLTVDAIPIRKWHLLCKTFDVWSKYAKDGYLRKFLVFLLSSSLVVDQHMDNRSEHPNLAQENLSQENYMKIISENLFNNALFYEEEPFRRIFASTFSDELEKSLVSAFGEWPFKSYRSMQGEMLSPVEEWVDYTKSVEGTISLDQEQDASDKSWVDCKEHSSSHAFVQLGFHLPSKQSVDRSNMLVNPQLRALDLCAGLVHYLSLVPSGYIHSNELALCAHTIICFERLLVNNLLQLRAIARAASHGSGSTESANFSIVCKLLKAFCRCRRALLALVSSEGPQISCSPLLTLVAGSFGSLHWFSLSTQAVMTCLVDLLKCSSLPRKEEEGVLSLGKDLLCKTLKDTASLMTFVFAQSLRIMAQRLWHQDESVPRNAESINENLEHDVCISNEEKQMNILTALMAYEANKAGQLLQGRFMNDPIFKYRGTGSREGDGCATQTGVPCSLKIWFAGLVCSTSLCSYFWSLSNFLEDSIQKKLLPRPLFMLIESKWHVQKLGHVLTEILLSAILPVGSHAILLLGEHGMDRSMGSRQENINFVVQNQDDQQDSLLGNMVDRDEEDDDEKYSISVVDVIGNQVDDDEKYGISVVDVIGNQVDDDNSNVGDEELVEVEERRHMDDELAKKEDLKINSLKEAPDVEYTEKSKLQRSVLENMLQGCSRDQCDVIGQLYLTLAGVLKIESILRKDSHSPGSQNEASAFQDGLPPSVSILMGAAYWLLLKAAERTQPHEWSQVGWLAGVVKYMESMYYLLPDLNPPLPPVAFSRLFSMHLSMLGSLTPCEETCYGFKLPHPLDIEDQQWMSIGHSSTNHCLGISSGGEQVASSNALRIAVRDSLGILLRTASRQQSVLALQSIMRALVGASEDSKKSSGLEISALDGGKVGRSVAAGSECLSIALESVSGMKRLRLLANHFNEFFGAIFNLMEYLQGPNLFQKRFYRQGYDKTPEIETERISGGIMVESGPVILRSLQILLTTASRDTIFPMKPCHVALALHCPARLFSPVYHSGLSKHSLIQSLCENNQHAPRKLELLAHVTGVVRIETELGVSLYILSCRLLCSLIRHRRRESGHCIALLEDSARVLLQCLEAPNWPWSEGETRDWSIKMVIYCACWLRRIYEEMGEHKDTWGKYCSHILADYLSVLAGHGPHAAGLMREVEAALQPGAYALVDACSTNDLQQLHAALGEGPRRNALLNLRRQYQQRFMYTGKV